MNDTVNLNGVLAVISDCITCGVRYTVPKSMWDKQQTEGGFHKCPNGHSLGWNEDGCENAKLRRERDRLKQQAARKDDEINWQRDQRETAERSASAYKGQVTKLKKRAKAGVCPCCNRTFQNLARHMESKHSDMVPDEPLKVIEGGKQ